MDPLPQVDLLLDVDFDAEATDRPVRVTLPALYIPAAKMVAYVRSQHASGKLPQLSGKGALSERWNGCAGANAWLFFGLPIPSNPLLTEALLLYHYLLDGRSKRDVLDAEHAFGEASMPNFLFFPPSANPLPLRTKTHGRLRQAHKQQVHNLVTALVSYNRVLLPRSRGREDNIVGQIVQSGFAPARPARRRLLAKHVRMQPPAHPRYVCFSRTPCNATLWDANVEVRCVQLLDSMFSEEALTRVQPGHFERTSVRNEVREILDHLGGVSKSAFAKRAARAMRNALRDHLDTNVKPALSAQLGPVDGPDMDVSTLIERVADELYGRAIDTVRSQVPADAPTT